MKIWKDAEGHAYETKITVANRTPSNAPTESIHTSVNIHALPGTKY